MKFQFAIILVILVSIFFTSVIEATNNTTSCGFEHTNALAAIALNSQFAKLKPNSNCTINEIACVDGDFAQCPYGEFILTSCGTELKCFALPLVNSNGTTITCDTPSDALNRINLALECKCSLLLFSSLL